jgi:hypothetical protein
MHWPSNSLCWQRYRKLGQLERHIAGCCIRRNSEVSKSCDAETVFSNGQSTSSGFAVDLLASQRICLQHVCSKSPVCCRLAVDLSVLNHIHPTDLLPTQRICLQHLDTSRCCKQIRWWQNAVNLLETCWRFAVQMVSQQVYSKSPAYPCNVV